MVPGSPRSGPCAESRDGPQPGGELPTGSRSGSATVDVRNKSEESDYLVKSVVDRCLGKSEYETAASGSSRPVRDCNEDNMSVSSFGGLGKKRSIDDRGSASDLDTDIRPHRGRKVLRSRIVGSGSEESSPIVISDSPLSGSDATRVRKRKSRV